MRKMTKLDGELRLGSILDDVRYGESTPEEGFEDIAELSRNMKDAGFSGFAPQYSTLDLQALRNEELSTYVDELNEDSYNDIYLDNDEELCNNVDEL